MSKKKGFSAESVNALLKSLLVLSRTVDQSLEKRAVQASVKGPLSSSKVRVLRLLGHRGGQASSQVARFLGVSNPAVTQIIDAMARSKLVVRRSAKHDRREVVIELTPEGRQQFRAVQRQQQHLLRLALKLSGSDQAGRWAKLLSAIAGFIARADQANDHCCLQCVAHNDETCVLVGGHADCLFLQHETGSRPRSPRRARSR